MIRRVQVALWRDHLFLRVSGVLERECGKRRRRSRRRRRRRNT
jgi:hypothetical protein